MPASFPTSAPTPPPATGRSRIVAPLGAYVGKYSFDKVGGTTFLGRSEVRSAVKRSGAPTTVRRWIFGAAGPQTPIVRRAGRLLSWGCQAHNCGAHNWTVFVTLSGSDAEICYHDEDATHVNMWFADGARERRADDCPSGDAT